MSARTEELARRRLALQALCGQQRRELGRTVHALERQLTVVDQGIAVIRRLASAPLLLGVSFGIIFFAGPRRLLRWAGQVLLVMAAYRRLTRASGI